MVAFCGMSSGAVSMMVTGSERLESEDAVGDVRDGIESVSSVAGSSHGGQVVCCCDVDVVVRTNAAATELCAGALLHLANCLAALMNAAA